ncbi:DUF2057 family protein [Vibrio parahaemolyticus]|uniref:YccT family protein n=1 Tax=Vibrio mediterranei TaxID=689 RepID=UPI0040695249
MKRSFIAAVLTAGVVFSTNAATLIPMKGISLLYINGQEAESKIKPNEVKPGKTQVVLQMDKKVGRGSSQAVYTSAPYVLTFDVTGDEIKINHPVARSKQEAEAVFRTGNPEWRVSQDGKSLTYSQEKLQGREGMLPYMGMDELVAKHNEERGITFGSGEMVAAEVAAPVVATAAVASANGKSAQAKQKAQTDKKTMPAASNANKVEQLKAWYLKASKEERKEFRKWMIDQE